MPAISVLLNGELLATVNTKGYDVVSVHIHGTKTDDEFAILEMSGGTYPNNGESTHLIWINSLELWPGQRLEVRLQESGETLPAGKTIEELFPEEADTEVPADFAPTEAMFTALRAKPLRREEFSFQFLGSTGTSFVGKTASTDHGFGFSLVWNSNRPERACCSLHAYTLDELENRTPMRDFVNEYVRAPYTGSLRTDA